MRDYWGEQLGRAILIAALLASITWPAGQASRTDGNIVLPEGAELTDTELAGIQGTSAPTPAWLQQARQACMATPYSAAGCGIVTSVIGAALYVIGDKTKQEIDREITPVWERFITEPLKNCGPWGWRCW